MPSSNPRSNMNQATPHDTTPFGCVPAETVARWRQKRPTLADMERLQAEIMRVNAASVEGGNAEEIIRQASTLRGEVGGVWIELWHELDEDIEAVYVITESFWRCVWHSMFRRQYHPQKYYLLCGQAAWGYGGARTGLANVMGTDELGARAWA